MEWPVQQEPGCAPAKASLLIREQRTLGGHFASGAASPLVTGSLWPLDVLWGIVMSSAKIGEGAGHLACLCLSVLEQDK